MHTLKVMASKIITTKTTKTDLINPRSLEPIEDKIYVHNN